jgi:hypothetical protein
MWLSWKGDQFELSSTGLYANLTAGGQSICVTGQNSISKISVKYSVSCAITPPPPHCATPKTRVLNVEEVVEKS